MTTIPETPQKPPISPVTVNSTDVRHETEIDMAEARQEANTVTITDEQLKALKLTAWRMLAYNSPTEVKVFLEIFVPALIAGVERLQTELAALRGDHSIDAGEMVEEPVEVTSLRDYGAYCLDCEENYVKPMGYDEWLKVNTPDDYSSFTFNRPAPASPVKFWTNEEREEMERVL